MRNVLKQQSLDLFSLSLPPTPMAGKEQEIHLSPLFALPRSMPMPVISCFQFQDTASETSFKFTTAQHWPLKTC